MIYATIIKGWRKNGSKFQNVLQAGLDKQYQINNNLDTSVSLPTYKFNIIILQINCNFFSHQ